MGQVSTFEEVIVQNKDIGRRIAEILEDKGISPNSFSQKIGMAKSTFYNCIHGERTIKPSELDVMGRHLKIPPERIKQEDTRSDQEELTRLLQGKRHLQRALGTARKLCSVALGITERSRALNDLGRVLYLLGEYDQAHRVWMEAHHDSEKLLERYGESNLYFLILSNLMISFTL